MRLVSKTAAANHGQRPNNVASHLNVAGNNTGLTLIELLIAVVIMGILLAISYPSYQQHILNSYRSEAMTMLLTLANAQTQYQADYGSFSSDLDALVAQEAVSSRYRFSVQLTHEGAGFKVVADAIGTQREDNECPQFTLNHLGQRNQGNPQSLMCWK